MFAESDYILLSFSSLHLKTQNIAQNSLCAKMAWAHPSIRLEDLLSLIKPFVDMLILASGHQSSGCAAEWSPDSVKAALRWGVFFEDVLKELQETDDYCDSVCELDSALADLTSDPLFPQGLTTISSETLPNARNLFLQCFIQSQPLMSKNLFALFSAVIEMEMDYISKLDEFSKRNYVDKLTVKMEYLNFTPNEKKRSFYSDDGTVFKTEQDFVGPLFFLIEEILKRKNSVFYISSAEKIVHFIRKNYFHENIFSEGQQMDPRVSERLKELIAWNEWKSKSLSYFLSEKTIKILSGANLIFSAPKNQWIRVLQSLMDSSERNFLETIEIGLLGLIEKRWNYLAKGFISQECDFTSISTQYSKLQNLLRDNSHDDNLDTVETDSKEKDILEYVIKSLTSQPHQIWQIPSILFAAAIPSRSIMFKIYMAELEKQFNGTSSITSRCNYAQDGTEFNQKCELEERIRGLYAFHIRGPQNV